MGVVDSSEDFNCDYSVFITGFGRLDKKIDKMNELKMQVKQMKKVDKKIDQRGNPEEGEFYTTKHYYYGLHVKKVWLEYITYIKEIKAQNASQENIVLAPHRSPNPTPNNLREESNDDQILMTTQGLGKENNHGHLPPIQEQPSQFENTALKSDAHATENQQLQKN